ncbi:MAG TPA: F0F1 ATP synthase subunit B [Gemmatimonadaceae bacterium]|nr:F0F1 ATP synthase subunit B [Gemmatimonadaceae bacterium]
MRSSLLLLASLLSPAAAAAQEHEASKRSLLSPDPGLMFWTFVIFLILLAVLAKFAYPKILAAVEAREQALNDAIEGARKDREAAAALLAEQQRRLEATRDEAQKLIQEGRAAGDTVRAEVIAQAQAESAAMLERARAEIGAERDRAVAQLRREAVELAIRGASRVLEKNLDDATNRKIVEDFLGSVATAKKS